ncbi:MAG TPA: NADH-quinone oxidoreductase subunit J [Bryobacteraceae bacterium]|jgi:NADH-quinone oxidoreductase subunit J|nr:NADH-quinone oxidoreductase subunit J [Bryobacteraceae bacterium]
MLNDTFASGLDPIFFYAFALLTLGGAVLTITRRNAVHSAISLIVSLLGVAGLYLLQHAEFLFAVQIVLYVGGIMVLFLFVIMLVNLDQMAKERQFNRGWMVGLAAVVAVGVEIAYFFYRGQDSFKMAAVTPPAVSEGNTEMLAGVLFRQYLLPFEIASILLLVAVVGSVVMAKKRI